MDSLIFISHYMDQKMKLWGCGPPRGNKKKKSSTTIQKASNNGDHHHHVNLATVLIKFVKDRCSSFTVKKSKRKRPSSREKKHPRNRKPKTGTAPAVTAKKHPGGTNLVTLQDWMSVELSATGTNSGEFHVFNKQVAVAASAAAYKKIHPSLDRSSHNVDGRSYGRRNSRRDQHIMEKLITIDGGAAVVEAEVASLPPRQSSGDTEKKKVSFRLPLVTNTFIFGTSPDLKE